MKPRRSFMWIVLFICFNKNLIWATETDILRRKTYPPCKSCLIYVDSFKRGLEGTAKGKYEGGDTAWEEEKLGSYVTSEVRLTEIQENICSHVENGKNQCYTMHGEHDHLVEEWWFNYQLDHPDLFVYLCVNSLKVCCLDMHYGPDCLPCSGYPDNVCSNNGHCKGAGTRKGDGKCVCNDGYTGEMCDQCATMYYESYRDNTKLLCSKCHISCSEECTKPGPLGCTSCASGWFLEEEQGCVDVNECTSANPVCDILEFCVNSEGSYKCLKCDPSCYGCTGDGPDMCVACATGYILADNLCIDSTNEEMKQHVFVMRYLTYLGLTIATCIILQRNVILAAIIGTCVSIYIALSEYMLNTPSAIINIDSLEKHIPRDL